MKPMDKPLSTTRNFQETSDQKAEIAGQPKK